MLTGNEWNKFRRHIQRVKDGYEKILVQEREEHAMRLREIESVQQLEDETRRSRQVRKILNASFAELANAEFRTQAVTTAPPTIVVRFKDHSDREIVDKSSYRDDFEGSETTVFVDIQEALGRYHVHGVHNGAVQYLHEGLGIYLCLSQSPDTKGSWVFERASDRTECLALRSDDTRLEQQSSTFEGPAPSVSRQAQQAQYKWVFKPGVGIVKEEVLAALKPRGSWEDPRTFGIDGDDTTPGDPTEVLQWYRGTAMGEWQSDPRIVCDEVIEGDNAHRVEVVDEAPPVPPPKVRLGESVPAQANRSPTVRNVQAEQQNFGAGQMPSAVTSSSPLSSAVLSAQQRRTLDEMAAAVAASKVDLERARGEVAKLSVQVKQAQRAEQEAQRKSQMQAEQATRLQRQLEEDIRQLRQQIQVKKAPPVPQLPPTSKDSFTMASTPRQALRPRLDSDTSSVDTPPPRPARTSGTKSQSVSSVAADDVVQKLKAGLQEQQRLLKDAENREEQLQTSLRETQEQLKLAKEALEHKGQRRRIASPKRRPLPRRQNEDDPNSTTMTSPVSVPEANAAEANALRGRVAELEDELKTNYAKMEDMQSTVRQMETDMQALRDAGSAGRSGLPPRPPRPPRPNNGSTGSVGPDDGNYYATMTSGQPGAEPVRLRRPSTVGELLERMDDIISDSDAAAAARVRLGSFTSDGASSRDRSPSPFAGGPASSRGSPGDSDAAESDGGHGGESELVTELRIQLEHETSKMQRLEEMIRTNTASIIAQAQEDQEAKERKIAELEEIVADLQSKLLEATKKNEGKGRGKGRGRGRGKRVSAPAMAFGRPPPRANVGNGGGGGGDFSMERARYERTIADLRRQLAQVSGTQFWWYMFGQPRSEAFKQKHVMC